MSPVRNPILDRLAIACGLLEEYRDGGTDEECRRRTASRGLHVHEESGRWGADWLEVGRLGEEEPASRFLSAVRGAPRQGGPSWS